jgi:hypothetical protein
MLIRVSACHFKHLTFRQAAKEKAKRPEKASNIPSSLLPPEGEITKKWGFRGGGWGKRLPAPLSLL